MPEARWPVAIVGGGIAGLAAAYALTKRGVRSIVLEREKRVGGVIRTEHAAGFTLEVGPDSLLAQKPEGLALCRELGLGDRLIPTNPAYRSVFIVRRGRLHALPEGTVLTVPTRIAPFLRSRLFSWRGKLRMGCDLVVRRKATTADESIADFMKRRFGGEALRLLGEPLLAGIHSGDPSRLSMRATFPRFVEIEARHGSLIRGMLASRPPRKTGPTPAMFYSLNGGLEGLVAALVPRVPATSVQLDWAVSSLAPDGDGYSLGAEDGRVIRARAVILAAPAPKSAALVSEISADIAARLRAISFVSTAIVFLGFRREDVKHPLDGYGFVTPAGEGLRTAACTFFSTKYLGSAPDGLVLLRGFLGGARDANILALDDETLAATFRRECAVLLGASGDPVLVRVYRWPQATPQMEVGHLERMADLEGALADLPGLFLTGAGLRSTGIPDGIADATRIAEAAAQYLEASY